MSLEDLSLAETILFRAIRDCEDIGDAVSDVTQELSVLDYAFTIYPRDKRRMLLLCLVEPVSDWALDVVISTLELRGKKDSLAQRIKRTPPGKWQLWQCKVHEDFYSGNTSSSVLPQRNRSSSRI